MSLIAMVSESGKKVLVNQVDAESYKSQGFSIDNGDSAPESSAPNSGDGSQSSQDSSEDEG